MGETNAPRVAVFAGINGAGKSTSSRYILTQVLHIPTFVNADTIARGLSEFEPEKYALKAGRIMLDHLDELAAARLDFALETTLAARTYVSRLASLRDSGYEVYLYYYWLKSPEVSIQRVAGRVAAGGHNIPEATIRQRYPRSVKNFFDLYAPICTEWTVYDNTVLPGREVATMQDGVEEISDPETWERIQESANR